MCLGCRWCACAAGCLTTLLVVTAGGPVLLRDEAARRGQPARAAERPLAPGHPAEQATSAVTVEQLREALGLVEVRGHPLL